MSKGYEISDMFDGKYPFDKRAWKALSKVNPDVYTDEVYRYFKFIIDVYNLKDYDVKRILAGVYHGYPWESGIGYHLSKLKDVCLEAISSIDGDEKLVIEAYYGIGDFSEPLSSGKIKERFNLNYDVNAKRLRGLYHIKFRNGWLTERIHYVRLGTRIVTEREKEDWIQEKLGLDVGIDCLGISVRSYNALSRGGIRTVGELVDFLENPESRKVRNVGSSCMLEVKNKLIGKGYLSVE